MLLQVLIEPYYLLLRLEYSILMDFTRDSCTFLLSDNRTLNKMAAEY